MSREDFVNKIYHEDCVKTMQSLPEKSIDLILTSPPYFNCRSYGGETVGRENHPQDYINKIVEIMDSSSRILKDSGSMYLNIGDVYFGTKGFSRNAGKWARKMSDSHYKDHKTAKQDGKWLQHKQLLLIPSRVASALQDRGWVLRNSIIWEKLNPLPSFSKDRRLPCYEYVFHFVRSKKYYFDYPLAKELSHHRDVIRTAIKPFHKHPASFSESLIAPLIRTTCPVGGVVYDPFMGSGTTACVSKKLGRSYVGSETNEEYCTLINENVENIDTIDTELVFEDMESMERQIKNAAKKAKSGEKDEKE